MAQKNTKIIGVLGLLAWACLSSIGAQTPSNQVFAVAQLRKDVTYMRQKMEHKHPNLYLYTPKDSLDKVFDALYSGIGAPMTATQFYAYITAILPHIKDGHHNLLPSPALQKSYAASALYFPLNVAMYDEKMYVTQNLSADTTLHNGDEIMRINGTKAIEIFRFLVAHQVRDGDNLSYPEYISQTYFRSYYGFLFGFCESYTMTIKNKAGATKTLQLPAEPLASIKQRRKAIQPPRYDRIDFEKGIFWETHADQNYTLLHLKTWSDNILRTDYHQKFKPVIADFIADMRAKPTQNLIIDLRGNQGGEAENGIYLLQYLLREPFRYFYTVKTYNAQHALKNTAAALTKTYAPHPYIYGGNVYVLTNGGSFSNSGIFAAQLKNHKRATIIGTQTGGNAVTLSGGADYYTLPATGINLLKATNQMIITDQMPNTGEGVKPDMEVKPTLWQLLDNEDIVLDTAVRLILNNTTHNHN